MSTSENNSTVIEKKTIWILYGIDSGYNDSEEYQTVIRVFSSKNSAIELMEFLKEERDIYDTEHQFLSILVNNFYKENSFWEGNILHFKNGFDQSSFDNTLNRLRASYPNYQHPDYHWNYRAEEQEVF